MAAIEQRKQFHDFIDNLPEDKLPDLWDIFVSIIDKEDEKLSKEEEQSLNRGIKEIESRETISFDELYRKIHGEE